MSTAFCIIYTLLLTIELYNATLLIVKHTIESRYIMTVHRNEWSVWFSPYIYGGGWKSLILGVDEQAARDMFNGSRSLLEQGGTLRLVCSNQIIAVDVVQPKELSEWDRQERQHINRSVT